jgi:hypothetical protein
VPTPTPVLEERLTFATAFDPAPAKIAVGAVVAVVGIVRLIVLLRRGRPPLRRLADRPGLRQRHRCRRAGAVAGSHRGPGEFEPPEGIRPGQLGTLIDEQANLLDVTATIIDLAVRASSSSRRCRARATSTSRLPPHRPRQEPRRAAPYEVVLMDSLFETGSVVELSDLKYKFSAK